MRTLEEINQELAAASQEIERAKRLDVMLKDIQEQQVQCQQAVDQAKAILAEEEQDVEEMERLSFASFIARIKGELKERTEQERREAVAAKARCDAASCNLADLEHRRQSLQSERGQLGDPQQKYQMLLREKENALVASGTGPATRLDEIGHRITALDIQLREVDEALSAGQNAALELEQMSNELAAAADWGTLDLMGGGVVSTKVKHDHMDQAKQRGEKACAALSRFRTELADVVFQHVPDIQLDDFTSFADYFFDGIFADLFVQEKIQRVQDSVTDALCEVEHALSLVNERQALLQQQRDELDKERLELLK